MFSRINILMILIAIFTLALVSNLTAQQKSVTEFHDDFESGDSQWILNDSWGLDGMYVHGGNYSLSDSPGGLYPNNTELYAEGGMVCEILPNLDFSAVPDVNIDFWYKYDIRSTG